MHPPSKASKACTQQRKVHAAVEVHALLALLAFASAFVPLYSSNASNAAVEVHALLALLAFASVFVLILYLYTLAKQVTRLSRCMLHLLYLLLRLYLYLYCTYIL